VIIVTNCYFCLQAPRTEKFECRFEMLMNKSYISNHTVASTHIGFGYCESGFSSSAAYTPTTTNSDGVGVNAPTSEPLFVFGNPGARRSQGFLFTINKYEKVTRIILKDSSSSKFKSYSPLMGYSSAAGKFSSRDTNEFGHVMGECRLGNCKYPVVKITKKQSEGVRFC